MSEELLMDLFGQLMNDPSEVGVLDQQIAQATPPSPDQAPTALARSFSRKLACRMARLPGVSKAAPTPSSTAAPIENLDVRSSGAEQRSGREPDRPDQEDLAPSIVITQGTAQQDERSERKQVAGQHPLQRAHGRGEIAGDVR